MENSIMGSGTPLEVAPEDAHYEHIQEHLEPLSKVAQAYQGSGQISPEQLTALTIGIEHTGQHMQYLSQDQTMKQQFQEVAPIFRNVQSVARGALVQTQRAQQGRPQSPT